MNYLYHAVPKDLEGDTLYPLNTLKEKYPNLYKTKVAKYADRESILQIKIPTLDCLWNDVLHFTAVPPELLIAELSEAGRTYTPMNFYKVDPRLLKTEDTTVYLYKNRTNNWHVSDDEFVPLLIEDLPSYASIPDFTKQYYRERYLAGEKPLLYHGVPHILYKGSLRVHELPIVTV